MGRWKLGDGGAYYDSQDSGPDQVAPPTQAPGQGQPQGQSPGPMGPSAGAGQMPEQQQPWGGPISVDFGQEGGLQWGQPGNQQRRVGNQQQFMEWLAGIGLKPGQMKSQVEPTVGGDLPLTGAPQPGATQPQQGGIMSSMFGRQVPEAGRGSAGSPMTPGLATGGFGSLGKAATGLGALGRGLFGR